MASYPTSIPTLTRPATGNSFDSGATKSTTIIDAISDELEAIAAHIGATGETDQATIRGLLDFVAGFAHAELHAHDGVDNSGTVSHGDLDDLGEDDHHTEIHAMDSASHTGTLSLALQGGEFGMLASNATFTSNTSFADLTDLAFDVEASSTYLFEALVYYEAATGAADAKIQFTGPASPTLVKYSAIAPNISGTGVPTNYQILNAVATAFSTSLQLGGQGSGVIVAALVTGIVQNGSNSGTVQMQGAQDQSSGTSAIFHAGSHIIARKVA
jgi:hypothetical protein